MFYVKTGSLRRALDWEDQHFSIANPLFCQNYIFCFTSMPPICDSHEKGGGVGSEPPESAFRHRHLGLLSGAFPSRGDDAVARPTARHDIAANLMTLPVPSGVLPFFNSTVT